MTNTESLSDRIRACADKHGVWDDVLEKVKKDQDNARHWDQFFDAYGNAALANADIRMDIGIPGEIASNVFGRGLLG
jgi:hypothetical protein